MATYTTLSEAQAAYLANADYADGSGDITKARAFRTACRALVMLMPEQAQQGQTSIRMRLESLDAQISEVSAYISACDTSLPSGGRVLISDLRDARE